MSSMWENDDIKEKMLKLSPALQESFLRSVDALHCRESTFMLTFIRESRAELRDTHKEIEREQEVLRDTSDLLASKRIYGDPDEWEDNVHEMNAVDEYLRRRNNGDVGGLGILSFEDEQTKSKKKAKKKDKHKDKTKSGRSSRSDALSAKIESQSTDIYDVEGEIIVEKSSKMKEKKDKKDKRDKDKLPKDEEYIEIEETAKTKEKKRKKDKHDKSSKDVDETSNDVDDASQVDETSKIDKTVDKTSKADKTSKVDKTSKETSKDDVEEKPNKENDDVEEKPTKEKKRKDKKKSKEKLESIPDAPDEIASEIVEDSQEKKAEEKAKRREEKERKRQEKLERRKSEQDSLEDKRMAMRPDRENSAPLLAIREQSEIQKETNDLMKEFITRQSTDVEQKNQFEEAMQRKLAKKRNPHAAEADMLLKQQAWADEAIDREKAAYEAKMMEKLKSRREKSGLSSRAMSSLDEPGATSEPIEKPKKEKKKKKNKDKKRDDDDEDGGHEEKEKKKKKKKDKEREDD